MIWTVVGADKRVHAGGGSPAPSRTRFGRQSTDWLRGQVPFVKELVKFAPSDLDLQIADEPLTQPPFVPEQTVLGAFIAHWLRENSHEIEPLITEIRTVISKI